MPDEGWIRRAFIQAQKMLESKEPKTQALVEDLALFPDQIEPIVRSFVDWHVSRRGGDDAAWRTSASKHFGIPERAVVRRRAMGLIQLKFTEHVGQDESDMHRRLLAQVKEKKNEEQAALLLPKAALIVQAIGNIRQQINVWIEQNGRISASTHPTLRSFVALLDALEQGRETRLAEYCGAFVQSIQDISQQGEKLRHQEQTGFEAMAEIERLESIVEALQARQVTGRAIEEVSTADISETVVSETLLGEIASMRIAEFRRFLQEKQAVLRRLLEEVSHSQEKIAELETSLEEQKRVSDEARKETDRLGRSIASKASSMRPDELQAALAEVAKARWSQDETENALEAIVREIATLRRKIVDPTYDRRVKEVDMNLSFTITAVRTTEELLDNHAWEGNYDAWETAHPELTRISEISGENDADEEVVDSSDVLMSLEDRRQDLELIPFYRLYTDQAAGRLMNNRGSKERLANAEHLFQSGIHAYCVLNAIKLHPHSWKQVLEQEICKHRDPQGVYRTPQTIEEGLRQKGILMESGEISWEQLTLWLEDIARE